MWVDSTNQGFKTPIAPLVTDMGSQMLVSIITLKPFDHNRKEPYQR